MGRDRNLLDAILSTELSNIFANEPGGFVTDDNIRYTLSAEWLWQFTYGRGSDGGWRKVSVYPLRMGAEHHQYHSTHNWTCVIETQPRPRSIGEW